MAKTIQLYQVECDAQCGFLSRNHNEAELVAMLITHCVNTHHEPTTEAKARADIRRL